MTKTLFRFVQQAASLAQERCDAGLAQISNPSGNGHDGWKHVVLYYLRAHGNATYDEVVDLTSEMDRVRRLLSLPRHGFPDSSTQ